MSRAIVLGMATTLLLLGLTAGGAAGTGSLGSSLFQAANEAYSRGDYDQAIEQYRQLITADGLSAAVLYNLANSHALSGDLGRAVLNYERALRLDPADPDIAGNLELVRKENGLFPKPRSGPEQLFGWLSLDQWTVLAVMPLVAFTLLQLAAVKYRFSRQLHLVAAATTLLLVCLAGSGLMYQRQWYNPSVVLAKEARLHISPFDGAASSGTLQQGRLVYPRKTHGEFTLVVDETDRSGWLRSATIEPVCSPTGKAP